MIHNHEVLDDMTVIENGRFLVLTDTVYNAEQRAIALDLLTVNDEIGEEFTS
jgi:hypothetical protein